MIELYLCFGYTFMSAYLHSIIKLRTFGRPFDSQKSWLNFWHKIKMSLGSTTILG
jgi:D-alanyl-lipoteichoic acid acyltransferase DltB (MBOAT superfamily)